MQIALIILLTLFSVQGIAKDTNRFSKFAGLWTLKDDAFEQVWDTKTLEKIIIANHNTQCEAINTDQSILCIVDAGNLKGHILWTYDSSKHKVHHLSHFGDSRNGVGMGKLDGNGNLTSRVSFQGEPEGTYRIYQYNWVNNDEYTMISTQFTFDDKPTGNYYRGTFIRMKN